MRAALALLVLVGAGVYAWALLSVVRSERDAAIDPIPPPPAPGHTTV